MQFDLNYFENYQYIIGCDEVGRGPLAGPVVGCAVKINRDALSKLSELGLTDSKKLSDKKRADIIKKLQIKFLLNKKVNMPDFSFCLWEHSPIEIDEMNILQASLSCMSKCASTLMEESCITLIDGNKEFKEFTHPQAAIVKGDSKSLAIGLASVIAKVYRDNLMKEYAEKFPGYGLEKHAGYPTKFHKEAIKNLGITPIHRKTFKGVKEFI